MDYQRKVFLRDVDATGRIYFAVVFNYAMEAFECLMQERGKSLKECFSLGYGFPVVHAEANYFSCLTVDDEVSVTIALKGMSERSFTTFAQIKNVKTKNLAAEVIFVHAFIQEGEEKASKIPKEIRTLLESV